MDEEVLPARAPVDVPAPETSFSRFGVLVERCAELAVLAGVSGACHIIRFLSILHAATRYHLQQNSFREFLR
jgi:hypothetical protein